MKSLFCRFFGHTLVRLYQGRSVDRFFCVRCGECTNQRREAG